MAPGRSNADRSSAAKIAEARPRSSAPANSDELEALRKENEELRRNGQYRSLLLSRLAHELRTPLTSILGFSEILLSQEKLTAAQRGFCERIQSSGYQLQASLNQLSDLARLEGAYAKVSPKKLSLADVLRDVLPALARPLDKKRVKVSVTTPDELPTITSDPARVRLVVYNLLSHAISRSREASPIFAEAAVTSNGVSIFVRDSGDALADPTRVGVLDADDNSSSGELGLSIARQNVGLLGGVLSARNLDEGAEVTVEFPLAIAGSA
jgi:signal transduction histidine kinase